VKKKGGVRVCGPYLTGCWRAGNSCVEFICRGAQTLGPLSLDLCRENRVGMTIHNLEGCRSVHAVSKRVQTRESESIPGVLSCF
jgi:hypothetical protein